MEHLPAPLAEGPPLYAAVLVDAGGAAARRPFDYLVPPALATDVLPGTLVVVPFGRRVIRGLVTSLLPEPAVPDPKPIRGLYRTAGLADRHADALADFIARRYACSAIEAYRAVLPSYLAGKDALVAGEAGESGGSSAPAGKAGPSTLYVLAPGVTSASQMLQRAPRQAMLVEALAAAGGAAMRSHLLALGDWVPGALAALRRRGLLLQEGAPEQALAPAPVSGMLGRTGEIALTAGQAAALEMIERALAQGEPAEFLLHGITGSGKTEVYLQAIDRTVQAGGQALVLVPEISLTPQTISRFEARFPGQVALLHSRLTGRERARAWRKLAAGECRIAVGPRSALFVSLPHLRLIVVDEEHEPSYKQEELPRYDAREVARERARLASAVLLFGSATPSLENYHRATRADVPLSGEIPLVVLPMPNRVEAGQLPHVELVDLRRELETGNRSVLSRRLQAALTDRLAAGEQSILFLNRRGLSTFVLCRECGYVARCPHCDVALVLHGQDGKLRCHHCGYEMAPPAKCPACGGTRIRYFGTGTERVEAQVREMFPNARIARLDSDVAARRGQAEQILADFASRRLDILVGTQMIGKGLDFPAVTLVGVISADTALNFPDFRAAERTFTLVTQVAGRAGRGERPGLVIVQSYSPEHYSLRYAAEQDYTGFCRAELAHRAELAYPPFSHVALVRVSGEAEAATADGARVARATLDQVAAEHGIGRVTGPSPAPLYRLQGRYRWNIVVTDVDPFRLAEACSAALDALLAVLSPSLRVSVDVDPQAML